MIDTQRSMFYRVLLAFKLLRILAILAALPLKIRATNAPSFISSRLN